MAELQEVRSNDEVVREIRELLEKMSMGQTVKWTIARSFRKCQHDRSPGCWPAARDPVGRRSPPRETSGASLATGDRVRLRPRLRTGSRRLEPAWRRTALGEVSCDQSQGRRIGRSQFQGSLCRCVFQVSTRRAYPFERSRVERPASSAIAEKSAAHDWGGGKFVKVPSGGLRAAVFIQKRPKYLDHYALDRDRGRGPKS